MDILNQSFPHPVLGIEDDVTGEYAAEYTVTLGRDEIILEIQNKLTCPTIEKMISEGNASFVAEILCGHTFFRRIFRSDQPEFTIKIPSNELRNKVEVCFYVCSETKTDSYTLQEENKDYEGYLFTLEPGDVIAYGGKRSFNAPKVWQPSEELAPFMVVKEYSAESGPMFIRLTDECIVIELPTPVYRNYNLNIVNKMFIPVFHASMALPALIHALSQMKDRSEHKEKDWYVALEDMLENEEKYRNYDLDDTVRLNELAQMLLGYPIDREMKSLVSINKYFQDGRGE